MEEQKGRSVGIDLAKRTMEVRILEAGKRSIAWNGKTDVKGRRKLFGLLRKTDRVYLEACALAFTLAREIIREVGAKVYVLDPRRLRIIWDTNRKTDKEDALKLARLGLRNPVEELPVVPLTTEEEQRLRALAHELRFHKESRVRYINRLHALYTATGITDLKRKDLRTPVAREKAAQRLIGQEAAEAKRLEAVIRLLEEQIAELEAAQTQLLVENEAAQRVMSIPGVGPAFAAAFMAFIGNGERFSSCSQVSNYVGLVPKVDQSGATARYGNIIKGGCSALKRVAVPAAWALTRSTHGGSLKEKYLALALRRGKKVAIVMLARRIVEIAYLLVRTQGYYDNGTLVKENPKLQRLKNKLCKKNGIAA